MQLLENVYKDYTESWFDVFGILEKVYDDVVSGKVELKPKDTLAIEFTGWSYWLGSRVDDRIIEKYGEEAFIAHCLYEITFCGFTEDSVKKERAILSKRIKDIDSGKAKYIPHDEVMKMLKDKVESKIEKANKKSNKKDKK